MEMTDYLVLGSGIAGLSFALRAACHGQVTVVTKRTGSDAATRWAQGGVAAVLSKGDSFAEHAHDTHSAGGGLCHERVVDLCVGGGPAAIEWLTEVGAQFSRTADGDLDLAREGGHSARRVVHAGDLTGQEIQRALLDAARAHPNIDFREWHMGVDLITVTQFGGPDRCVGAYILDEVNSRIEAVRARATVLATGGAGKVYLYTSNPDVATGDGVAMAYRAGAWLGNMEFFQFHPTCLYHPSAKSFLVSEALRGEGARLCLDSGEPFMERHHASGDLAPRDVVARAIDHELKRGGLEHVWLDISHKPASFVRERFPGIHDKCMSLGIDITTQPMPVVPAAHYMCGGVTSDLDGRTSLPGLWVLGETAFTGLHGANRLASNSLLEGLVFAHRAADKLGCSIAELRTQPTPPVPEWETGSAVPSDEAVVVAHNWDELRRTMWNYVGIVRSSGRLQRAASRINLLEKEIQDYYWKHLVTRDLLELRNIAVVAQLVISCARARRESRGLHFTIDFPETLESYARDVAVKRGVSPHLRGAWTA
jgi:L-aspartate oxidase